MPRSSMPRCSMPRCSMPRCSMPRSSLHRRRRPRRRGSCRSAPTDLSTRCCCAGSRHLSTGTPLAIGVLTFGLPPGLRSWHRHRESWRTPGGSPGARSCRSLMTTGTGRRSSRSWQPWPSGHASVRPRSWDGSRPTARDGPWLRTARSRVFTGECAWTGTMWTPCAWSARRSGCSPVTPGTRRPSVRDRGPRRQPAAANLTRSCMTALVCIWQIRDSVTPRTLPISASVRPS